MVIVLVRHAEPAAGDDPGLAPPGVQRAATLAKMLAPAGLAAIFTSELRRTKETAAPLAGQLSLTPVTLAGTPAAAATQLRSAGPRVLVVGHSNTVPDIIKALGGPADVKITPSEFNRMFVLHVPSAGTSTLLSMVYGV